MESTVKERLIRYLKYKRITQREFARSVGLSDGYVNAIRQSIQPDTTNKIAMQYPDLNLGWLLTGTGAMIHSDDTPLDRVYNVPLLPLNAIGGRLTDFVQSINQYECEFTISPIKGVDFAITVSGDSMAPDYPSGSKVLVKKINEQAFIDWGRVYVLDTCNGVVVKKIMPSQEKGRVLCVSINEAYPPFEVDYEDIFGMYRVLLLMSMK